ncbi:LCP family protein [Actinoplanes sp. DH11]|uniref:LCP family protein n=1 Tax=Actinoplanes sp. DH11 TaxID=2857011 RepID=UPI001E3CCD72|nr:LCP family protein [Actinoplanes sp. DH11]
MTVTADQPTPSSDLATLLGSDSPAEPPRKTKKRRSPLWARLTTSLGVLLLVVSGGGLIGGKLMISKTTDNIALENLTGDAKKTVEEGGGATLEGPIDMLLMGVDARERWAADELRSDTIIILHIPASHDQAYLISIPRDTEVQAPAFEPSRYAGGTVKATEAFYWGAQNGAGWTGGAQLLAKTLKDMTGISFDGAGIINFGGFKQVIDQLGGVRMCVDQQVTSKHMKLVDGKPTWLAEARKAGGPTKDVVHKVGCKQMEGWEALDYARQRYGLKNGDYDRQRHQQQLIKAMAKKAASSGTLSNPLKISSIVQSAGEALVLDIGDIELTDFVLGLSGVAANDMVLLRTNNGTFSGNGAGREVLNDKSQEMFQAVKDDTLARFVLDNPDVVATEK